MQRLSFEEYHAVRSKLEIKSRKHWILNRYGTIWFYGPTMIGKCRCRLTRNMANKGSSMHGVGFVKLKTCAWQSCFVYSWHMNVVVHTDQWTVHVYVTIAFAINFSFNWSRHFQVQQANIQSPSPSLGIRYVAVNFFNVGNKAHGAVVGADSYKLT